MRVHIEFQGRSRPNIKQVAGLVMKKYTLAAVISASFGLGFVVSNFSGEPEGVHKVLVEQEARRQEAPAALAKSTSEVQALTKLKQERKGPVSAVNVAEPEPIKVEVKVFTEEEVAERQQLAETKRLEIQQLMEEYKENIDSPERLRQLHADSLTLIKEYDALILPIAVVEMDRRRAQDTL